VKIFLQPGRFNGSILVPFVVKAGQTEKTRYKEEILLNG
jgi:hypothetical protein